MVGESEGTAATAASFSEAIGFGFGFGFADKCEFNTPIRLLDVLLISLLSDLIHHRPRYPNSSSLFPLHLFPLLPNVLTPPHCFRQIFFFFVKSSATL